MFFFVRTLHHEGLSCPADLIGARAVVLFDHRSSAFIFGVVFGFRLGIERLAVRAQRADQHAVRGAAQRRGHDPVARLTPR
jgi:hypothetical protein